MLSGASLLSTNSLPANWLKGLIRTSTRISAMPIDTTVRNNDSL